MAAAYDFLAPTGWKLHPAGPLATCLLGADLALRNPLACALPGSRLYSTLVSLCLPNGWKQRMHEMAMSESLVEIVEEEGRKHGFTKVRTIRIELGALGHVEPEALRFCFDAVTRGTIAEGAHLDIVTVAGAGLCLDCGQTVPLTERFGACPACGTYHVQMTAGDDLRIKELEVD